MDVPIIIKINAPQVISIPARDNGEKIVDILREFPQLKVDTERRHSQKLSKSVSSLRQGVVQKLLSAQQNLPKGIRFLIIEGYRPIAVQKILFDNYLNNLRQRYTEIGDQELEEMAVEFVAPPDIHPPHSTGGAVDLTLVNEKGEELDMGTLLNESYTENVHTYSASISEKAKQNRRILIDVLEKEGFVNYPAEWWHWSYGDRYWAFFKDYPFAQYESVEG